LEFTALACLGIQKSSTGGSPVIDFILPFNGGRVFQPAKSYLKRRVFYFTTYKFLLQKFIWIST
jgi:hypothetical protein